MKTNKIEKPSGQGYYMKCTICKTIYGIGEIHYCGKFQPPQPPLQAEKKKEIVVELRKYLSLFDILNLLQIIFTYKKVTIKRI